MLRAIRLHAPSLANLDSTRPNVSCHFPPLPALRHFLTAFVPLRGRGVPHLRGRGVGDQFVRVIVETPARLTPEQERLLRELAESRGEDVAPPDKGFFGKVKDAFS